MRGWNAKSWLSYIRLVWVESVMSMGVSAWSCDFGLICNIFFVLICGKSMWFCKLFRWIDIGSFDSFCVCASISFDGEIFFCLSYHSVWAVIYRLKCFFTLSFLTKTKFFEKRSLDMRVSSFWMLWKIGHSLLLLNFLQKCLPAELLAYLEKKNYLGKTNWVPYTNFAVMHFKSSLMVYLNAKRIKDKFLFQCVEMWCTAGGGFKLSVETLH